MYPREIGSEAMLADQDRLHDLRDLAKREKDWQGMDALNKEMQRTRAFYQDQQSAWRRKNGFSD